MQIDHTKIDTFMARYSNDESALIQVLQDIQTEYRYLPREALEYLSDKLNVSLSQTYNVVTFYNSFSLTPKGEHHVCVCLGTACHVRGAQGILEKFEREMKVQTGDTTEDLKYSLDKVACLGACALGPIVTVNNEYHGQMKLQKVDRIMKNLEKGQAKPDSDEGNDQDQDKE